MIDDAELLRRYAKDRSEDAFAELVRRHLNLVYGAALRRSGGDVHRAADVAQLVFTELARKAASLTGHAVLSGWLYATTRNKTIDIIRSEQRRQNREQEVQIMHEQSNAGAADVDWERLRPVLDDVLDDLGEDDREAVLLRFLDELSFSEIGTTLRVSEDAARMRVGRSLEKLRAALSRRGVTSTTAALAVALTGQVGMAAPAGLLATVTTTALAGTAVAGSTTAAITFMSISKISIGLVTVLLAAGSFGLVREYGTNRALRSEVAELRQQNNELANLRAQPGVPAKGASEKEQGTFGSQAEAPVQMSAGQTNGGQGDSAAQTPVDNTDRALRKPVEPSAQSILESRYVALARRLNLTPAQQEKFKSLLAAKRTVAEDTVASALEQGLDPRRNLPAIREAVVSAQSAVDARFKEEFGEAALVQYQQYEEMLPQHNTVDQLASMLRPTDSPLSETQIDQLEQILARTREPEGKGGIGRILNGDINHYSKISAQTIQQAGAFLTEQQLNALTQLQQQQLAKFSAEGKR